MQLLVSVADASEGRAALLGGADVIDAKDPREGALGAVRPEVLGELRAAVGAGRPLSAALGDAGPPVLVERSEEHTSELQSQSNLVCRLLLEKKKKKETDSKVV